jgi:hypothetical protein
MTIDASKSIEACAKYYGDAEAAMRAYLIAGEAQALALDNRGPIRFDKDGNIDPVILDAYSRYGFYIFENVLDDAELEEIKIDLDKMRDKFPTDPNSEVNHRGEKALGAGNKALNLVWSKPLGDPLGGTSLANGPPRSENVRARG